MKGSVMYEITVVRSGQYPNAKLPIEVTLLGMEIEVRVSQSSNEYSPILITELGIVVFMHPSIN